MLVGECSGSSVRSYPDHNAGTRNALNSLSFAYMLRAAQAKPTDAILEGAFPVSVGLMHVLMAAESAEDA
jgi:hypothetical protein